MSSKRKLKIIFKLIFFKKLIGILFHTSSWLQWVEIFKHIKISDIKESFNLYFQVNSVKACGVGSKISNWSTFLCHPMTSLSPFSSYLAYLSIVFKSSFNLK